MLKLSKTRKNETDICKFSPFVVIGKRADGDLVVAVGSTELGALLVNVVESISEASVNSWHTLEQLTRFSPDGWEFDEAKIKEIKAIVKSFAG